MHERFVALAPARRVTHFHFAHALDDWLPEISQHDKGFSLHGTFVQHFPHNRQFHQRSRTTGARHIPAPAFDQLEQPLLPRPHANLFLHPPVRVRFEKFRRHRQRSPATFFRPARDRFHHSAVAAAADCQALRS